MRISALPTYPYFDTFFAVVWHQISEPPCGTRSGRRHCSSASCVIGAKAQKVRGTRQSLVPRLEVGTAGKIVVPPVPLRVKLYASCVREL